MRSLLSSDDLNEENSHKQQDGAVQPRGIAELSESPRLGR